MPASVCGSQCVEVPQNDCLNDSDCTTASVCVHEAVMCCERGRNACRPRCTATSCAAGQRCGTSGKCEILPCADGYVCPSDALCDSTRAGADEHGCAPLHCTEGFDCGRGYRCTSATILRGCVAVSCTEVACPTNQVCQPATSKRDCVDKPCTVDADCDCGFCAGTCVDRPLVCLYVPF